MSEGVRVERDGPVFTVLLSRPERRNAVDGPAAAALAQAFAQFDADEDAAVAVLHGEGGVFCAGADLKAIGSERGNRVAADGDGPMGPTRMRLGKPVIAAIAGHAVAGGLELALWCDLRVAETDAVLGVFCRRWGVPLIDGGTVRLPRLIGVSHALDLVLTGRAVGAEEALRIGLVNRVVATGESRAAAEALAHELARFPQACLREDRLSLLESEGLDEAAAMAGELEHGLRSLAEVESGLARFRAGAGRHGAFDRSTERSGAPRPAQQRVAVLGRQADRRIGADQQRRPGAPGRPLIATPVEGVVEPGQRALRPGVAVDRLELPVRSQRSGRGREDQVGERPG